MFQDANGCAHWSFTVFANPGRLGTWVVGRLPVPGCSESGHGIPGPATPTAKAPLDSDFKLIRHSARHGPRGLQAQRYTVTATVGRRSLTLTGPGPGRCHSVPVGPRASLSPEPESSLAGQLVAGLPRMHERHRAVTRDMTQSAAARRAGAAARRRGRRRFTANFRV